GRLDEPAEFRIRHVGFVHPETVNANVMSRAFLRGSIRGVAPHRKVTAGDPNHAGRRLVLAVGAGQDKRDSKSADAKKDQEKPAHRKVELTCHRDSIVPAMIAISGSGFPSDQTDQPDMHLASRRAQANRNALANNPTDSIGARQMMSTREWSY